MSRCPKLLCRDRLITTIDAIGRVTITCPACEKKRNGICRHCTRPVYGTKGRAHFCKQHYWERKRAHCMRWQKNNRAHVAQNARKRRWKLRGEPMPEKPMTLAEAGRMGAKLGHVARLNALTPERIKEIAAIARKARWNKYREQKFHEAQARKAQQKTQCNITPEA